MVIRRPAIRREDDELVVTHPEGGGELALRAREVRSEERPLTGAPLDGEDLPAPSVGDRDAKDLGDSGRHVHRVDGVHGHVPSLVESLGIDDQGDAQLLFVEAPAVAIEAVIAELLTVVGGDDDGGVFHQALFGQPLNELPHRLVDVGDLSVIEVLQVGLVFGAEASAWCVASPAVVAGLHRLRELS